MWEEFQYQFQSRNLWERFALTATGCQGPCGFGPNVLVYPEGVMEGEGGVSGKGRDLQEAGGLELTRNSETSVRRTARAIGGPA